MSLLSPFFLAGMLLIAGPIIAHLIRRATNERVTFSALRFLTPSTPRLDRRSRIQHPLLLIIRCLIVALLALAFARPYWEQTTPPVTRANPPRLVIALLDRSASMRTEGRWDEAVNRVEAMAAELAPTDVFALTVFDQVSQTLITSEQWQEALPNEREGLIAATLRDQSPTWQATWVDNAVAQALESVREVNESLGGTAGTEVVIVSDLTSGLRLAGLAGLDWPADTVVRLEPIEVPDTTSGFSLQWLGWGTDNGQGAPARVRVSGSSSSTPRTFSLQLRDALSDELWQDPIEFVMSTSGTQLVSIPVTKNAPEALRIELSGDHPEVGRSLHVVRDVSREIRFQIWGDTEVADTGKVGFYLQNATSGWRDPRVVTPAAAAADSPALHVVTAPVRADERAALQEQLANGAFVLVLADSFELVSLAAQLAGESNWAARLLDPVDPLLFGQIDFTHPLFASFADPRFSDFTRIRFSEPLQLELPADSTARVVARFDNEQPAIVEQEVGGGRLIVWATGWTPSATPWVLSTKFVPWLQALAERATGGDRPVAVADFGEISQLSLPSTTEVPNSPGVYELAGRDGKSRLVGLNVPVSEIQRRALSWDAFEEVGVPLSNAIAASAKVNRKIAPLPEAALVSESRQRAWRWFILLTIGLLVIEGLLAMYFNRRLTPSPESSTAVS